MLSCYRRTGTGERVDWHRNMYSIGIQSTYLMPFFATGKLGVGGGGDPEGHIRGFIERGLIMYTYMHAHNIHN